MTEPLSPPRVMFLIRDMECGGAQRVVVDTLRLLCETSLELHLGVMADNDYAMLRHLEDARVKVVKFEKKKRFDLGAVNRLRRYLKEHMIDILHMHGFPAAVWGRFAGRWAGVPVIIRHMHTNCLTPNEVRFEKATRFLVDQIVLIGESNRETALTTWGVPADRIRMIHNTVDSDRFSPSTIRNEEKEGVPQGSFLVGTVGRLSREKGHDILIQAARRVIDREPDVRFIIVGEGPFRDESERLIRNLGLKKTVRLPGTRTDVADFYRSLDLFVLPSRFEGLPMCLLEAMACGCASVVTNIGGSRDLVRDGVEGLVVPPEDPEALGDAILRLLSNSDTKKSMAKAARERVLAVASPEANLREHLGMYRECLERKGIRRDWRQ